MLTLVHHLKIPGQSRSALLSVKNPWTHLSAQDKICSGVDTMIKR